MNKYNPSIVTAPGESLIDFLEQREISHDDFAERLGVSMEFLSEIFEGKALITHELADRFEQILGTPAYFWMKREQHYRENLAQRMAVQQE